MEKIQVSIILPVYNVEKYLAQALDSFRMQSLEAFEVIMIDDGSTDSSAEIMKKYAAHDQRFRCFYQKNKGVAQTRNRGMQLAQGEYIAFYDSDDWILPKVLEKMYGTAKTQKADIVVGAMEMYSAAWTSMIAKDVARKTVISRFDEGLIWTFSLANKLFRKKFLDDYGFRLERIAYAEDGLFFFQCIAKAGKIAGCDIVAYQYRKRPSWSGRSVTQQTNKKLFDDFIYAYEKIIALMTECFDAEIARRRECAAGEGILNELQLKKIKYISELYYKLELNIIRDFYRQIWQADDTVQKRIIEKQKEYQDRIFTERMNILMKNNSDLSLADGLRTKEELAYAPLVTIAVTDGVSREHAGQVLFSIYSQNMPAFEVIVHKRLEPYVDSSYQQKENFRFVDAASAAEFKNKAFDYASSRYIQIIDEDILLMDYTLRYMYALLQQEPGCGFVTVPIRRIDGEQAQLMKCNIVLYIGDYLKQKPPLYLNMLDHVFGDKLLSADHIKEQGFIFTDDAAADIRRLYQSLEYKKRMDTCVAAFFDERFLLSRAEKLIPRISYKFVKNMQLLKDHDTRRNYIQTLWQKMVHAADQVTGTLRQHVPIRNRVFFYTPRGGELLENSRALYEALDCKKVVFAKAGKRGRRDARKVTHYLLTSRVIVIDDYCNYMRDVELKPQQKLVQIWHACGAFKKFGLDHLANDRNIEKAVHRQYDVVCVSSENVRAAYAGAFGIGIDKVQALGVPRTDLYFDQHAVCRLKSRFYAKYPELEGKKIILYCPTFWESGGRKVMADAQINWNAFSKELPEDTVMLIKNHPVLKGSQLGGRRYPNIWEIKEDTSTLLLTADLVVTDYSSVIFECCILNKPIVFYCPDFDEYERDFYLEFPDDLYGELVVEPKDLRRAVLKGLTDPDLTDLERFKETYMGACDGHSTQRIADLIHTFIYKGGGNKKAVIFYYICLCMAVCTAVLGRKDRRI